MDSLISDQSVEMYNTRKERDETTETGGSDLVLHIPHIVGSGALALWRALDQAIHRQMLGHGFHCQLLNRIRTIRSHGGSVQK
jgi:hypothetical protein